jgi:hypothetical protein
MAFSFRNGCRKMGAGARRSMPGSSAVTPATNASKGGREVLGPPFVSTLGLKNLDGRPNRVNEMFPFCSKSFLLQFADEKD